MTLKLTVSSLQQATPRIRVIQLADQDGNPLPEFAAGAHINVETGDAGIRSYSLIQWTHTPNAPQTYCIAVQLEDEGAGGSAFMHSLSQGQVINASSPENDFALAQHDSPAVLIAGGIGITPIISMAASLQQQARPYHCHYTGRSRTLMGLADELETQFGDSLSIYTDDESPLNMDTLLAECDPQSHLYICGPSGMIEAVRSKALTAGFSVEQLHIELFSAPDTEAGDQPFEVEIASTGQVYLVPAGKSIIDVLEDDGVDLIYDCQRGDCGICQTDVISGTPDHRDFVLSDEERSEGKVMQICVSRAKSARLVLDI